ncbi:Ubiquitin-like modifier-activating enzyme 1 [Folsomia candida]|uniref:Ubiquitin-like modifier-activating enzyme 1 n=1 Tax=Folsomia candida TaxID=158441 RepID=A0A226DST0_FOLCA|nr:Ubiquitin-like modifier-activating enzyme 1 [Folsomia candida]
MFTSQILPVLKWRTGRPIYVRVPIKFHPQNGSLMTIKSSFSIHRYSLRLQCILPIVYTAMLAMNLIFGSLTIVQRLQGAVFLMLCVLTCTTGWNSGLDDAPVRVVNTFLDFEKDLANLESTMGVKVMKYFICLAEISIIGYPILQILLLTFVPCTAPFVLSMLPMCKNSGKLKDFWTWPKFPVRMVIHLLETWLGYDTMYSCGFGILYVLFGGTACILGYIDHLEKKIRKSGNINQIHDILLLYKRIQLVEKSFNNFTKNQILPFLISCAVALEVLALFVCIDLHKQIEMPGFLIFPMVMVDSLLTNLMVLTFASYVNKNSTKVLSNLTGSIVQIPGKRGRNIARRRLRSCPSLKVQIWMNFVNRLTPLTTQTFCLNQTVSLIMIKD